MDPYERYEYLHYGEPRGEPVTPASTPKGSLADAQKGFIELENTEESSHGLHNQMGHGGFLPRPIIDHERY